MPPDPPDRRRFCRLYYRSDLSYDQLAAALGVDRDQVDGWRRQLGLPSRRWVGTVRPGEIETLPPAGGPCRHDILSGRIGGWRLWWRPALPPAGLLALAVRRLDGEDYWELR